MTTRTIVPGGRPGRPSGGVCAGSSRIAGHVNLLLGSLTRRALDHGGATAAVEPADDRLPDPHPVARDGVQVETPATVADEHAQPAGFGLGVDRDLRRSGV